VNRGAPNPVPYRASETGRGAAASASTFCRCAGGSVKGLGDTEGRNSLHPRNTQRMAAAIITTECGGEKPFDYEQVVAKRRRLPDIAVHER